MAGQAASDWEPSQLLQRCAANELPSLEAWEGELGLVAMCDGDVPEEWEATYEKWMQLSELLIRRGWLDVRAVDGWLHGDTP